MTKTKKIWLGIFLSLFILPELLWSPIINLLFIYSWKSTQIFRPNLLVASDTARILYSVLLIQALGLVGSLVVVLRSGMKRFHKTIFSLLLIFLLIITAFVFCMDFSFRRAVGF